MPLLLQEERYLRQPRRGGSGSVLLDGAVVAAPPAVGAVAKFLSSRSSNASPPSVVAAWSGENPHFRLGGR